METTCGSLLSELQKIWGEVGEPESEKDKMLLELERECLEAYRRKVDQANQSRAQLRKAVADSEAELAYICSAMGERPLHTMQSAGSLKKELEAIMPLVEEMRKKKFERRSQFVEVLDQIKNISKEICRSMDDNQCMAVINESDLSLKRLEGLHIQLRALQKEKSDRLKQVLDHLNTLNSLCVVLGVDFKQTVSEIHPSLDDSVGTKNISTKTMERLSTAIQRLRQVKIQRLQQVQDLATTMVELWSLMDTPIEEQLMFQNVTKNIAVSENEITEPNALSLDFINYAEAEVSRLKQKKSSKIKEVILKKRSDLEELCRKARMVAEAQGAVDYSVEAIESGMVDPSYVLEHIELQISKVKEEAFSRKDILDKVEKWLAAREEECWLEEYNRDDNRFNAGRGTHLILKRAEKARAVVNKIPAMVEALTSKATAWERERGVEFSYDGVHLLSMLENYTILKREKEQERQRERDQKKLEGQLLAEQEVLFGTKPSPSSKSGNKVSSRASSGGARSRRLPLGGQNSRNHHQSGSSADLSSGKKILDTSSLQVKQQTHNASNSGELIRKPLSPVNSALLSKANTANIQDLNMTENAASPKPLPTNKTPVNSALLSKANAANIQDLKNMTENLASPKPLPSNKTPVNSALLSKANAANIQDLKNMTENAASQKPLPTNKTPVSSPTKIISAVEDENKTPRTMPVPMPATPPTVSIAMQTASTPATPCVPCGAEDVEYSFEERRASFILPKSYLKSLLPL